MRNFQQLSLNKNKAFTLIELLIVALILGVILSGLFATLNIGNFSFSTSSAKLELQSYVRLTMERLIRDIRDTNLLEINNNNPSTNHIKFRKVSGIDNSTGMLTFSPDYIEYNYNNVSNELSRYIVHEDGTILRNSTYSNIMQAPFYSAPGDPLAAGEILSSKSLVIVIASQKQVKDSLFLNFSLAEEVAIRNE